MKNEEISSFRILNSSFSRLPVNLNALLRQRRVEGDRIEYKANERRNGK